MTDDRMVTEAEDDRDAAVIAADDTGMISSERSVVVTEIEHGLDEDAT